MAKMHGNPAGTSSAPARAISAPPRSSMARSWAGPTRTPEWRASTTTSRTPDGDMVAGLMVMPPDAGAMPPFWMIYFAVDDADKAAADVKAAGGAVHREPADIPGTGRFAVLGDPQGAGFGILQPEPMAGGSAGNAFDQQKAGPRQLERADDHRPGGRLPLLFRPLRLAEVHAVDMGEMGTYQVFSHDGTDIGGMMGLGNSPAPAWLPYFGTNGVDRRDGADQGRRRQGRARADGGPRRRLHRRRPGPAGRLVRRGRTEGGRAEAAAAAPPTLRGPLSTCRSAAARGRSGGSRLPGRGSAHRGRRSRRERRRQVPPPPVRGSKAPRAGSARD